MYTVTSPARAASLRRLGSGLAAAATLGLLVFTALAYIDVPPSASELKDEALTLAAAPRVVCPTKGPPFLELSDGATPAWVQGFESISDHASKERLRAFGAGVTVIVSRPRELSGWHHAFTVWAVRSDGQILLSPAAAGAAYRASRRGPFYLAAGIYALALVTYLRGAALGRAVEHAA